MPFIERAVYRIHNGILQWRNSTFTLNFFQNLMKTKNFILFPILHDSLNRISFIYHFRRIAFVHETGLAIVYGLIMGAIIRFGVQEEKEVILKLLFKLHHKKTSKIDNSTFYQKIPIFN